MNTNIRKYVEYVGLKNGITVLIRAIRASDKEMLAEAFHRLSASSVHFRFLCSKKELSDEELSYLTELDLHYHVGLIALTAENGFEKIIGVARYFKLQNQSSEPAAEFAVAVIDQYQNLGLGTLLLERLVQIALQNGITRFEADILTDNYVMKHLLGNVFSRKNYSGSPGITKAIIDISG